MAALTKSDATGRELTLEDRILAAAVRCVARWGLRKTTLDDVAREAGCSRASIYRTIPGGKDALMAMAGHREVKRVLVELAADLERAATLSDALVAAVNGAARAMASNEAFQNLLAHEPGAVLPFLSFDGLDPLLERAVVFGRPTLERFVDPAIATELAELVARIVVAYGPDAELDLTDSVQAHRLVATFVLPGVVDPGVVTLTDPPTELSPDRPPTTHRSGATHAPFTQEQIHVLD